MTSTSSLEIETLKARASVSRWAVIGCTGVLGLAASIAVAMTGDYSMSPISPALTAAILFAPCGGALLVLMRASWRERKAATMVCGAVCGVVAPVALALVLIQVQTRPPWGLLGYLVAGPVGAFIGTLAMRRPSWRLWTPVERQLERMLSPAPSACRRCGSLLVGLTSGVCPECGQRGDHP